MQLNSTFLFIFCLLCSSKDIAPCNVEKLPWSSTGTVSRFLGGKQILVQFTKTTSIHKDPSNKTFVLRTLQTTCKVCQQGAEKIIGVFLRHIQKHPIIGALYKTQSPNDTPSIQNWYKLIFKQHSFTSAVYADAAAAFLNELREIFELHEKRMDVSLDIFARNSTDGAAEHRDFTVRMSPKHCDFEVEESSSIWTELAATPPQEELSQQRNKPLQSFPQPLSQIQKNVQEHSQVHPVHSPDGQSHTEHDKKRRRPEQ